MGAWGENAFDSDNACDFRDSIVTALQKPIHRLLSARTNARASYFYEESRAASEMLLQLRKAASSWEEKAENMPFTLDDAIRAHERMLGDEQWISAWREPKKVIASIRQTLKRLRAANVKGGKR